MSVISCEFFCQILNENGIGFFSGVPDSLLKDFCAYVTAHYSRNDHVIAANEGGAVALASGVHLATGEIPLVYMQNSGQGNAANPLISLADPAVYSIPLLLLIGWRGQPGVKDEPQHKKQGAITLDFLDTLRIPYRVLSNTPEGAREDVKSLVTSMKETQAPAALVVQKGTFEAYKAPAGTTDVRTCRLTREEAIKQITDRLDARDVVVSTTGKISRELYEYRANSNGGHHSDFLTVGSMGHCSQIAMGIAISKSDRRVFCLDGDGAVIMHMGALAIIGSAGSKNLKHIVLNNGCHDSVGGQPTCGFSIDIVDVAKSCGYFVALRAETRDELDAAVGTLKESEGPALLEVRVSPGSRSDLGRPSTSPAENKSEFMRFLQE